MRRNQMKVNLKEVETKEFALYDNGAYAIKINSIEEVTAGSGNQQLRIKTEFIDGPYVGKQLTDHITLVEQVAWKLKKFLASVGLPSEESVDTDSGAFRNLMNKAIGKTAIWVVGQRAGQDGTLRNNVLDYKEDPNAPVDADDPSPFLDE
jgi:hypothetical protein